MRLIRLQMVALLCFFHFSTTPSLNHRDLSIKTNKELLDLVLAMMEV